MTALRTWRLGEIVSLKRRKIQVDPESYYSQVGIRSYGKGFFDKEPILGADLGNKRIFEIRTGDLVLNNVFAWEGAVALAGPSQNGRCGSHRFPTYEVNEDLADASYLRYYFLTDRGLQLLGKASPGSAGRNRTLNLDTFESLEVRIPGVEDQRNVASHIDELLPKAATAERHSGAHKESIYALYPAIAAAILRESTAYELPLSELVGYVSDVVRPGDDPSPAITFVGFEHVESHTGRRIGELPLGEEKGSKKRFRPGDIVYGRLRPYLNKVWVADRHGLCSVDQLVLRARGHVSSGLIAHSMRSRRFLDEVIRLTHTAQLPRIRQDQLDAMLIPLPKETQADEVERRLEELRLMVVSLVQTHERRVTELRAVRSSIINGLVSQE